MHFSEATVVVVAAAAAAAAVEATDGFSLHLCFFPSECFYHMLALLSPHHKPLPLCSHRLEILVGARPSMGAAGLF